MVCSAPTVVQGPGVGDYVITDGEPYYIGGGPNDTAYYFTYLPTGYCPLRSVGSGRTPDELAQSSGVPPGRAP